MFAIENSVKHEDLAGSWEPSWGHMYIHKYRIDRLFPVPPPHTFPLIWAESYKYWVLRKNSLVLSVAVAWFWDTLVLTSPSSSASLSTSPFFNIPWERVSCLPGAIFWLSLEHCWPPWMWSSLHAWLSWEPSDLSGLEPGSSPWDLAQFWGLGLHEDHLIWGIWEDFSLMAPP